MFLEQLDFGLLKTVLFFVFLPNVQNMLLQKEVDETESLLEKAALYRLSLSHLETEQDRQQASDFTCLRDQIFTSMWRCRIQDRVARKQQVRLWTDYL